MTASVDTLLGSQVPTFAWIPEYGPTLGPEAVELAAAAGLVLDEWQRTGLDVALALNKKRYPRFFELCIIMARQNGKDSLLEALELAWLFLAGEKLVMHSAHLFETSREHFQRINMLVQQNPDFDRRIDKIREGRGAEEIILKGGARLKFMTRKGGAGRGFTGGKVILNEAMYLDRTMMAAALPTLATQREAQVIYTASAGMKHSTQLGWVRQRAYKRDDDALAFLEWAAERAVYNEDGDLIGGDDPKDPRTWAKVNPAQGTRITVEYITKEMAALGGPDSPEFLAERLGIGDYPVDDDRWAVIGKTVWDHARRDFSKIVSGPCFAVDTDPDRDVTALCVCGINEDGVETVEVLKRQRGARWIPGALAELKETWGQFVTVILKTGAAGHLIPELERRGLRVESPTETLYAQACEDFAQAIAAGQTVHIGQPSLTSAVGGAEKREGTEGGWRWNRDAPSDQSPLIGVNLARWGRNSAVLVPRSKIW